MVNKISLLVVCFVTMIAPLWAVTIDRGKLRLVVNDKSGRYSLFAQTDSDTPVFVPLYVASDPTTSQWRVTVDHKTTVLGEDSTYTTAVEQTDTGVKTTWSSKQLVITMRMDFLVGDQTAEANGLKVALNFVNVSDAPISLGVRWLLDTNLGEKMDHFLLTDGTKINSETVLNAPFPPYWESDSPTLDSIGLRVFLGEDSTPPSSVIFANWKRLDDSRDDFRPQAGREFNLLPYSFNDSAVLQTYALQDLASGSARTIVTELGLRYVKTLRGARTASSNPLDLLLKQNQDPALSGVDQDMVTLDALIKQLDAALKEPSKVTLDDLRLLQAAIDQIEARQKSLSSSRPSR